MVPETTDAIIVEFDGISILEIFPHELSEVDYCANSAVTPILLPNRVIRGFNKFKGAQRLYYYFVVLEEFCSKSSSTIGRMRSHYSGTQLRCRQKT